MTLRSPEKILLGCVAENNDKYLSQAVRLVRSVRWFAGSLSDVDIVICAVEGIEPGYRRLLESYGAAIRIVPRLDPANPLFNKVQIFRLPELARYDTLLYLDCDTIVMQDPSQFLSSSQLRIKVADVPTVPTDLLERVCGYFGLMPPERIYKTTQDQAPTIWYCNAGVISCPVRFIPRLIPAWCEYELAFSANPDLLGAHQHHRSQAALALAFIANPVPFKELPVEMNFPLNLTHLEVPSEIAEADPVILHYHDLVDIDGCLLPSPYPRAQRRIEDFNKRLREAVVGGATVATRSARSAAHASTAEEIAIVRLTDGDLSAGESLGGDALRSLGARSDSPRPVIDPVVVCVAGMHRSGTSMIARLIHTCGVYLGPERDVTLSSPDNERGFWEYTDFVNLNDALLETLGGAWDAPPPLPKSWSNAGLDHLRDRAVDLIGQLNSLKRWGWKDPRNSLTLPFWRQLIPKLKVIICLRNPLEVIQSLAKRGSSADESLLELWHSYNRTLMATIPSKDRLITHYGVYFSDAQQELRRVLEFLGITASDENIGRACETVSDELRHHRLVNDELREAGVPDHVAKLYLAMCDEAGPLYKQTQARLSRRDNTPRRSYRDILISLRLEAEVKNLEAEVENLEAEVENLEAEVKNREAEVRNREADVKNLEAVVKNEVRNREALLRTHEAELASLKAKSEAQVVALEARLSEKQAELDKITNTLGWRLLSQYGKFKYGILLPAYRFFRPGSSNRKR